MNCPALIRRRYQPDPASRGGLNMRVRPLTGSSAGGPALGERTASWSANLLPLHAAMEFGALWEAVQGLLEHEIPHDTLVMSANYLNWRNETSARRLTSVRSRVLGDEVMTRTVAEEGRAFFQPFLDQNPGIASYRHSELLADPADVLRSRYYRRFMTPLGWRYSAHLLLWKQGAVETALALRRRADQGDFTTGEMRLLQTLQPHLAVALERTQRFEQERERRRLLESFYRSNPEAVLLLDWDLNVLYASDEAVAHCARWNLGVDRARSFAPGAVFQIPPELLAAAETLKTRWEHRQLVESGGHTPLSDTTVSRRQAGDAVLTLRRQAGSAFSRPNLVIRLRGRADLPASTPEERQRRLAQLSPSERDLARLVCAGLSNKDIAARSHKSEGTVKVQLSAAFRKLGVHSRTQLIHRLG